MRQRHIYLRNKNHSSAYYLLENLIQSHNSVNSHKRQLQISQFKPTVVLLYAKFDVHLSFDMTLSTKKVRSEVDDEEMEIRSVVFEAVPIISTSTPRLAKTR